jgi:DNA-binding response OmpR family regulator
MTQQSKVLIVDGKDNLIKGIKKGLEESGFYVKLVTSGMEAILLAEKEFFDIVLVDLVMLGMNGVETCKGIKEVSPKTEVLLLSGLPKDLEKYQISFIEAGGKDMFLRKPFLKGEIKNVINGILGLI